MIYIIYSKSNNKILRELDFYEIQDDNSIIGGINNNKGRFTYSAKLIPAILEITKDEWDNLDKSNFDKYIIENNKIIIDENYEPYQSDEYRNGYDQAVLDLIEMGVL